MRLSRIMIMVVLFLPYVLRAKDLPNDPAQKIEKGFAISPEAMKTFQVQNLILKGSEPWSIPASALVLSRQEKIIYLFKNGFFQKIPVNIIGRFKSTATIESPDLKNGMEIAVMGVEFLRITDVALSTQIPEAE